MNLKDLKNSISQSESTVNMPALFIGHGSPVNGIEINEFSKSWIDQGKKLPKPAAILVISAHWLTSGTLVQASAHPKTIYDFYGFPDELYRISYPCPGSPQLARKVQNLINSTEVRLDQDWGLDHGSWIVLSRLFPKAEIPVFQLSLDFSKPAQFHYELAGELAALRQMGVLIIGSGNVVHNLREVSFEKNAKPYQWATEFNETVKKHLHNGNHQALINYEKMDQSALLSIPSPDHYWPLLYILGLQQKQEQIKIFTDGITHSSLSMLSFLIR